MFRCLALAGLGTLATAGRLAASDNPDDEDPVVLDTQTVYAHPAGTDERTAAIWVLGAESFSVPPQQMTDVLSAVPGVHLDQPGGPGGRSTLYLRGADENQTVVVLDGIPLNDPTNSRGGAVDLSLVDPAALTTASVVRGPASVRFGAEALAGIVHLNTTPSAERSLQLAGGAGGDGLKRGWIAWTQPASERVSIDAGAAWLEDGSIDDGSAVRRMMVRGAVRIDTPMAVQVSAWHIDRTAHGFPDDSGGQRYAVVRDLERRDDEQTAAAIKLSTAWAGRRWTLTADAAQLDADTDTPAVAPGLRDPEGLPATVSSTRLRRVRVGTLVEHEVRAWTFSGGIDAQHESGHDDSVLDFGIYALPTTFDISRDRAGIFAEAAGEATDGMHVTVGGRLDHWEGGLDRGTVRGGVLGSLGRATSWRLNAGNAFKPPSFYALANPLVGNPDLRPERATTIDAGLRHAVAGGRALLDLSAFATDIKDGIDFEAGPPPRLVNRAAIRSRGAEAAVILQPMAGLTVTGALTYTDARSRPDGERMRSRPRWRGNLAARWEATDAIALRASLTMVDRVPDTSIPTGDVMLDGWARLDLASSWRISSGLEAIIGCDNALDADYEQAVGFPSPGRRVHVTLRARF